MRANAISLTLVLTAIFFGVVSLSLPAQPDGEPTGAETIVEVVEVPAMGLTIPGKVLSVQDGDTLKVEFRFTANVRLIGAWAPEITGATKEAGIKSREHLKRIAEGQPCIVHIPLTSDNIGKATSMGRVLGKVMVNGDDLSYLQVRAKMATKKKQDE